MTGRYAFWIASEQYFDEATNSLLMFRQKMPDIPAHLVYVGSGMPPGNIWFDTYTLMRPAHEYWFLDSAAAMFMACEKLRNYHLLYLDTDTWMVEPVYEIFWMLEHGYDFVAAHAPGRCTAKTFKPIPDAFPEFNVGVCGFGHPAKSRLTQEWYRQYYKHQDTYGNNDQASLREVLWNYKYHVGTLPPEYNFRFNFGGFLRYHVKVLHGRHPDMARVANSVNEEEGMRVWKLSDME